MTTLPYKNKRYVTYGKQGLRRARVTATCVCGKEFDVILTSLTRKNPTRSCGCARKHMNITHGMTGKRIYKIWSSMLNRCHNKKYKQYDLYGGRGITVSPEWHKFKNFYRDMGEKPDGKSLDRVDNDKGYSKENCRWSSLSEQARNKRNIVVYKGEHATDADKRLGGNSGLVRKRLNRGWSLERAFLTPSLLNKQNK